MGYGIIAPTLIPMFRLLLFTKKNIRVHTMRCGGCSISFLSLSITTSNCVHHHHCPNSINRRLLASHPLHASRQCQKVVSALVMASRKESLFRRSHMI
jgi:hypothetical protein